MGQIDKMAIAELWHMVIYKTKLPDFSTAEKVENYGNTISENLVKNLSQIETTLASYGAKFLSRTIKYDKEKRYLKLPQLEVTLNDLKMSLNLDINPCVEGSPHTKIISIPAYEGALSKSKVSDFFSEAKEISVTVCKTIGKFYFQAVNEYFPEQKDLNYDALDKYHLYAYVIGSEIVDFDKVIDYADDDIKMAELINASAPLKTSLEILERFRMKPEPSRDYSWFVQERGGSKGMFGFYSDKSEGNFVGLTIGNPHKITKSILQTIIKTV